VDFAKETKIRHLVNTYQGQVLHVDYAMQVTLQISLAAAQAELFTQQVINETAGDALVHIDD
jgi:putative IMPACT (imprinted ancient) family translation regulator